MVAVIKPTPKTKAPPNPKFGEVGYEFDIKAKIIGVVVEDGDTYYNVFVGVGNFYEQIDSCANGEVFAYCGKENLIDVVASTAPSILKTIKLEELSKAKAEVARLTKELAALK
jgi:hypothetical protein